jgi:hypothetical protein
MVKERAPEHPPGESAGKGKEMKNLLRYPPAIGSCLSFVNTIDEKEGRGKENIPNAE